MTNSIDMALVDMQWEKLSDPTPEEITDGTPYATHRGVLNLCGAEFEVFQLNIGQRVISEESLKKFLGAGD